jgi:hypothetical protein
VKLFLDPAKATKDCEHVASGKGRGNNEA